MGDFWSKLRALVLKFNDLCDISLWWSYILLCSSHMISPHWEGLIRKLLKIFSTFVKPLKTMCWIKWHMLLSWSKAVHPCVLRSCEGIPGYTQEVQQAAIAHSTAKSRWKHSFLEMTIVSARHSKVNMCLYLAPSCWWCFKHFLESWTWYCLSPRHHRGFVCSDSWHWASTTGNRVQ